PLQFPEHTRESYVAAAKMGAGIVECDVAFTKDRELVCRHAQNDLHTTTNILVTDLAAKCTQPFVPADPATGQAAKAECRTSDTTDDHTCCRQISVWGASSLSGQRHGRRRTENQTAILRKYRTEKN
ncbi:MAG: glycerophosphodiester phosphodiesterase family protein, partial [Flavobacteriales bacterium]